MQTNDLLRELYTYYHIGDYVRTDDSNSSDAPTDPKKKPSPFNRKKSAEPEDTMISQESINELIALRNTFTSYKKKKAS